MIRAKIIVIIIFTNLIATGQKYDNLYNTEIKSHKALTSYSENTATSNYNLVYQRMVWHVSPDTHHIRGAITSYFIPLENNFKTISFDLSDTITIDSVRYNSTKISFLHKNDLLNIEFPSILSKNTIDSVTVYYQGIPVTSSGFGSFETTLHDSVPILWTLSEPYGAKDWWPCKQSLTDKIDSIDIYIVHPKEYKAASNGVLISETVTGDTTVTHWKHRYPIATYLVAIAVTNYSAYSQYANIGDSIKVEILNYVYPENLKEAKEQTAYTAKVIELFSNLFIPYPFYKEKYGHAQFGWGGGMEHQTMSFMGSFKESLITHELSHQWFGDYVTCTGWHDIWVNEGFAVFCELLDQEYLHPEQLSEWKKTRLEYILKKTENGSVYVDDTTDVRRVFNYALTYQKGGFIIEMLRHQIGDTAFFSGIRNMLTNVSTAGKFASANDVKKYLEQSADTNLTDYFDSWYYGQGYPEYKISWCQNNDSTVCLNISQTTTNKTIEFFKLKIPILLIGDKKERIYYFQNTTNYQHFSVNPGFTVKEVIFDPDYTIIAPHPANIVLDTTRKKDDNDISIMPNPAGNSINIKFNNNHNFRLIRIYSSAGKEVFNKKINSETTTVTIKINKLEDGVFFISFEDKNGKTVVKKFIKN